MIDTAYLKQIFNDKLGKTGSFDDAFTKAVWTAFLCGLEEGKKPDVDIEKIISKAIERNCTLQP